MAAGSGVRQAPVGLAAQTPKHPQGASLLWSVFLDAALPLLLPAASGFSFSLPINFLFFLSLFHTTSEQNAHLKFVLISLSDFLFCIFTRKCVTPKLFLPLKEDPRLLDTYLDLIKTHSARA